MPICVTILHNICWRELMWRPSSSCLRQWMLINASASCSHSRIATGCLVFSTAFIRCTIILFNLTGKLYLPFVPFPCPIDYAALRFFSVHKGCSKHSGVAMPLPKVQQPAETAIFSQRKPVEEQCPIQNLKMTYRLLDQPTNLPQEPF
jgi:hypothetical protein